MFLKSGALRNQNNDVNNVNRKYTRDSTLYIPTDVGKTVYEPKQ